MIGNIITGLLPMLAAAGLIAFYFLIIKPKQHGKIKQRQDKSPQDITPTEPDQYEGIIDDYPTYHRQVK
jgi:hypothetical protein